MISGLQKPGIGGVGFCSRSYTLKNIKMTGWLEFSCVLFKSRAIITDDIIRKNSDGFIEDVLCLDPDFGMGYFEDDFLCLRLLMNGWGLDVLPQLVIHHTHQSTPDYVKKIRNNYKVFISKCEKIDNSLVREYVQEQYNFFSERCPWMIE
jgi:GT2 family glycosyltransferase